LTQYQFDFTLADVTLDNMGQINTGIKTMLTNLESNVERSLADWTGGAQTEYWGAKKEWDAAAAKMPECLQRARTAFEEISQGYDGAERQGAEMWSGSDW
jgi:WXG100 family type VII secretion target